MDGSVVAVAAASLLATKLGEGFAGEAGKSAWGGMKHLCDLVQHKFAGDPEAAAALDSLEAGPADEAHIRAVADALRKSADRDDGFRGELEVLLAAAAQDQSTVKVITQIFGDARVGKMATFGDVHGDVSI
jgi:hypothetical protein